jgi:hypothetical protein
VGHSRLFLGAAVALLCACTSSFGAGADDSQPTPPAGSAPAAAVPPPVAGPAQPPASPPAPPGGCTATLCDDFDTGTIADAFVRWNNTPSGTTGLSFITGGVSDPHALGVKATLDGQYGLESGLQYLTYTKHPRHIEVRFDLRVGTCNGCKLARFEQGASISTAYSYGLAVSDDDTLRVGDPDTINATGLSVTRGVWQRVELVIDENATLVKLDGAPNTKPIAPAAWAVANRLTFFLGVVHYAAPDDIDVAFDNVTLTITE